MLSISSRWLRRLFAKKKHSLHVLTKRRRMLRKVILENLEPRELMTTAPWSLFPSPAPPSTSLPDLQVPSWSPPASNIFGPREKVWISAFAPALESGTQGYLRIERSNPKPPLQVTFNVLSDSTAQPKVDYIDFKPVIVFEPGQSSIDFPIVAIDDMLAESTESIRFVLWDSSRIGTWLAPEVVSVPIFDNDSANTAVAVELLRPNDAQEGGRDGRIRARRTGSLDEPLTVGFQLTFPEELVEGQDFRIDPKSWTPQENRGRLFFPAGQALASVVVSAIDDEEPESTEWIDIRLVPDDLGRFQIAGKPLQTLRLLDNDSIPKSPVSKSPGISQLSLVNDTGVSASDRITWDERLEFTVEGKLSGGLLRAELDWSGDFIPDATIEVDSSPKALSIDPRLLEPELANRLGLRSIRYRSSWYSQEDVLLEQSNWKSFEYQVIQDPSGGPLRLDELRLKIDTGTPDDRISADPTVMVSILGLYPSYTEAFSGVRIEWDHNLDGLSEASELLQQGQTSYEYDPRLVEPNYMLFPGPRTLSARLVENASRAPLSAWESLQWNVQVPPVVRWSVSNISHSNPADTPRHWLIRGNIVTTGNAMDSEVQHLSVQIDTDHDGEPDATVPVESDFSFEHWMLDPRPGIHTLQMRVQYWSSEVNGMIHGNWNDYRFSVTPSEPPGLPAPRLRSDTGSSDTDRSTSDPTILIDVATSGPPQWLTMLDIDTNSQDSTFNRSIPIRRNDDGSPSLVVFQSDSLEAGPQRYRFRVRNIDPASEWETTSDWTEFRWIYTPVVMPQLNLSLVTEPLRISGQVVLGGDNKAPESLQIQIDWESDGTPDDWIPPNQDGSFIIRPPRDSSGSGRISARIDWADPYRNTKLIGDWVGIEFQSTDSAAPAKEIKDLGLLIDTGISSVDAVSSVATVTGVLSLQRPYAKVQIDLDGDRSVDDEVSVDSTGRFRYSPMGLKYGSHLLNFRTKGLDTQRGQMVVSPWQTLDFTYVASTLEPLFFDAILLANDSGAPEDLRSEQGAIAGRLKSRSGIENSVVLVDLDYDRQADATVPVGEDGWFLFDPKWNAYGQVTVSLQAIRISPLAIDEATPDRWVDFTYVLEDQADLSPELFNLRYVPAADGSAGKICGNVRSQSQVNGLLIEADADGDGLPDRYTHATPFGDFTLSLEGLSSGDYNYQLRVYPPARSPGAIDAGTWKTISFRIPNPTEIPSKITEFRLVVDDGWSENDRVTSDPRVTGKVDRLARGDGPTESLVVELDLDGDSIADEHCIVDSDLAFGYSPMGIPAGNFRFQARTMERTSTGEVLRSAWSVLQGVYVPSGAQSEGGSSPGSDLDPKVVEHSRGIQQTLARFASEKAVVASEYETENQLSTNVRLTVMREAKVGYWEQISNAAVDLQESQWQAFEKLSTRLSEGDTNQLDLPLPEELELLWPSTPLPNLPYLVSNWLPAEESLPQPPAIPPEPLDEYEVPGVAWSTDFSSVLNNQGSDEFGLDLTDDDNYRTDLQALRNELLSQQRSIRRNANLATAHAHRIYESALSDAQAQYRRSMSQNRLDNSIGAIEDYTEIYQAFLMESQRALEGYQNLRKQIEDRFRSAFGLLEESHRAQLRVAEKNLNTRFEATNRQLASVLNTVPPPEWGTVKEALLRHARERFDAQYTYDYAVFRIQTHEQRETYKLQKDRAIEISAAELDYAIDTLRLEGNRDRALAEQRYQYSIGRADASHRWDVADQLAKYRFEIEREDAGADLQRALIEIERTRRIGNQNALREFDLGNASAIVASLTRIDEVVSSPESKAQVQRAMHRRNLLMAWNPVHSQSITDMADLWKEDALAKFNAGLTKRLGDLQGEYDHTKERLDATSDFRKSHARLVRSHGMALSESRREYAEQQMRAEHQQSLEASLNGIDYLSGESKIASQSREKMLDSIVYEPPKLEGWLGGWGWIDGTFLGAVSGSSSVSPEISRQIVLDESKATAELNFRFETQRVAIDQLYFNRRDNLAAEYQASLESLMTSSSVSEFQVQRNYHLSVADADRAFAVKQVENAAAYELAIAGATRHFSVRTAELNLGLERQKNAPWTDYQRSIYQTQFELNLSQWDHYLAVVQRWQESARTPWTEFISDQAASLRNLGVDRSRWGLDQAIEKLARQSSDYLSRMQIQSDSSREKALSDFGFEKDKIDARKELASEIADAKFQYAQQTAGVSQQTTYGPNLLTSIVRRPNLLALKLEAANVTAQADTQVAQSRLDADLRKADAFHARSQAFDQLWRDFHSGAMSLNEYYDRVAFIERIFGDKLQQIDLDFRAEWESIDGDLRSKRAEIVRLLNVELELSNPDQAKWTWLQDVPKAKEHLSAHATLAEAIQEAQDRFALRLGQLQRNHQADTALDQYLESVSLSKIHYDWLERVNLLSESDRLKFTDLESMHEAKVLEIRNVYERKALENQARRLESIYRKLDPDSRVLLKQQVQAVLAEQSTQREAEAWKTLSESNQRRTDQSELLRRNRQTVDQIQQSQEQLDDRNAVLERDQKIALSRFDTDRMIETEKVFNAFQRALDDAQLNYDLNSSNSLEELNRRILERRTEDAQRIGDAWKAYYLSIHPDSGAHPALRRELDNWLGLRSKPDFLTSAAWRSEPIVQGGLMGFRSPTANALLQERLAAILGHRKAQQVEFQVDFANALSDAKAERVGEVGDAKRRQIESQFDIDESFSGGTHTVELQYFNDRHLSQTQWEKRNGELQWAQSQEDRSQSIRTMQRQKAIDVDYQQRIDRARVDYEIAWADAQSHYQAQIARDRAQRLQVPSSADLRSVAIAAQATVYARWVQDVSPDFVDWVGTDASARIQHNQELLVLSQERAIAERIVQNQFESESDAMSRFAQQEKADRAIQDEIERRTLTHEALQAQRQIDLDYNRYVLESQTKFLQSTERAQARAQIMKLQGYSLFDQLREKSAIVSDAGYQQAVSDSDALMLWKDRTAEVSLKLALTEASKDLESSQRIQRIEAELDRNLAGLEQLQSEAMDRARFEFQISSVASSGKLALALSGNQANWLVATSIAKTHAKQQLAQALPGAWAEFQVALAEQQQVSLEEWNRNQKDRVIAGNRSETEYVARIAQAQVEEAGMTQTAKLLERESEIGQKLELYNSDAQATIEYIKELEVPARGTIARMTLSERIYANEIAFAELEYRKDFDAAKYQQRKAQSQENHESHLEQALRDWNRNREDAIVRKRSAQAESQRRDLQSTMDRESLLAQQIRDARREWIYKEAEAYADSERNWSELEAEHAQRQSSLQVEIARMVDQNQDSIWSDFYLEITQAKADYAGQVAWFQDQKNQQQSRQQADYEKRQAQLQWMFDAGQWLASDTARRAAADLDWGLEQWWIQTIESLDGSKFSGDSQFVTPTPRRQEHPGVQTFDQRYELVIDRGYWADPLDPFAWRDTGFLAWVRSPTEQFPSSYWLLERSTSSLNRRIQNSTTQTVELHPVVLDLTERVSGVEESAQRPTRTPTHTMVPTSRLTEEALLRVDREWNPESQRWLELHARVLQASSRPEPVVLPDGGSVEWEFENSPRAQVIGPRESSKRFFVDDATPLAHVRWMEELDAARSRLIRENGSTERLRYPDRVVLENGIVYWRHAVGIESTRIEGNPITRAEKTPIGPIDRFGWVHLPSGKRVLYSALKKWAGELVLGSSDQIAQLIDGLISPFSVDVDSNQYGIFIGGTGMHIAGLGNVERLYNMYQGTKFYYGGVGNPTEYDSVRTAYADNAAGYGWTAILDRIEADVIANYRGHQKLHIFGWSRGGAMAMEFSRRMERYQIDVEFLGLFDPVYSYVLPGQLSSLVEWTPEGRSGNYVTVSPSRNVKAIGAIYAANEERSFFPATRIYSNGSQRIQLMKSPGAHGEIGGHFLSNLPLQRLNLKAMTEFASRDGKVRFEYRGIDPDLVRILASPVTSKLHRSSIDEHIAPSKAIQMLELAMEPANWDVMQNDQYQRELTDFTVEKWLPGGFGFQKDCVSGFLVFAAEASNELSPLGIEGSSLRNGVIQQSPMSHYRRNLDWCKQELWDMAFLRDASGVNRLSDRQKEAIRLFYRFRIDPKTGEWIRSGF